ncbi:HK97 family phage prohead protease [Flavobacterium sp.]|uniref:HK97 family phage prohead protease n=1 Tax=Flavobacterium sp. TaxID=239 RepID=UPI00263190AD|nr:HK97 family phage prohead protease [Flavobacterium sp.]
MDKDYIKNIEGAERRFFDSEVRAVRMDETNTEDLAVIEGYAAKFNSETIIGHYYRFREKILPGAFDEVLNDDVRCLFNHDPNYVLARCSKGKGTLTLSVDQIGLKYSYTTPDRQYAKDLANAIASGDVSQSSFAFEVETQTWTEPDGEEIGTREIVKYKRLYDVSPVTYPAYPDTEVAKRSFDQYKKENPGEEIRTDNDTELDEVEAQIIINSNLK